MCAAVLPFSLVTYDAMYTHPAHSVDKPLHTRPLLTSRVHTLCTRLVDHCNLVLAGAHRSPLRYVQLLCKVDKVGRVWLGWARAMKVAAASAIASAGGASATGKKSKGM